jgi:acyl-CoA synthetase (AMP-forming)/AMP-acid ligase II
MPISQPPAGKTDTMTDRPGSVGVPVAASTAIVNRANLRPQPPGVEGEIAISGPTVLKNYLANPAADQKSYFLLTLPENSSSGLPYFLTGDVGVIDSDGFLSLKGRAKELIKKGGEQVCVHFVSYSYSFLFL